MEKVSPAAPRDREPPKSSRAAHRHTRFSGFRESRVQGETATETSSARPPRASPPSPGASPSGTPSAAPASYPPGRPEPRGAHLAGAPAVARAASRQLHCAGRTVLRLPHHLPPGMRTNFRPNPPGAARAGDPPAAPLAGCSLRWTALPQLHRCRLRKKGPGGGH